MTSKVNENRADGPAAWRAVLKGAALSVAMLGAACGGGGGDEPDGVQAVPPPPPTSPPPPPPPAPPPGTDSLGPFETIRETAHFLTQATFGPTQEDLDALPGTSVSAWLQAQIAAPPSYRLPVVDNYLATTPGIDHIYIAQNLPSFGFWRSAVDGEDQLRQRMAFALSQILVVSDANSVVVSEHYRGMAYYQDILIRHALGNYRDLLEDVTYAPLMGHYLTYMGNRRANPDTGRMPDENYARELLQLFTIGTVELNPDGTPMLNAMDEAIETYDNADVTGLARVFTGLDVENRGDRDLWTSPMLVFENRHSPEEKVFLGTRIPPGTGTEASITMALDHIFEHPNVPPFIARQLIQRLVTSNPEPAYVERVANAFASGRYTMPDGVVIGEGRRGDLAATAAAVLFDPEARDATARDDDDFGKPREPVIRFLNWARAFNVGTVTPEVTFPLWDTSPPDAFAQHPYRAPSVFNFYRPGYVAPGTLSGAQGMTVPELQIVDAGSVVGYANAISYFIFNNAAGGDYSGLERLFSDLGISLDASRQTTSFIAGYEDELLLAADADALIDRLDLLLTYGEMSDALRTDIAETLAVIPTDTEETMRFRVGVAIQMVMTSPDYLVQR